VDGVAAREAIAGQAVRKVRGKRAVSDYRRAVNCVLALVRGVEKTDPSFSIGWLRVYASEVLAMPFFSEGENSLCRIYGGNLETDVVYEVHSKLIPARAARPPKISSPGPGDSP
jgi:hypothetical protein